MGRPAVATLVVLAGALLASGARAAPSLVDSMSKFNRLNNYLSAKTDSEQPEENLKVALRKADNIQEDQLELGEAIHALAVLAQARQCDPEVIRALGLVAAGANPAGGRRRVDRVLGFYAAKLYEGCRRFLEAKLRDLGENSLNHGKQMTSFLETVLPRPLRSTSVQFKSEQKKVDLFRPLAELDDSAQLEPSEAELAADLTKLAAKNPKNVYKKGKWVDVEDNVRQTVYYDNFKQMFNKYLVGACKHFEAVFGDYFDSVYALKSLDSGQADGARVGPALATNEIKFDTESSDFFAHLFRMKMCLGILNIDRARFAKTFAAIREL